mmetsp:Transcript_1600/g.3523  ORF Transcript_1600/g.3523 Transcript_1600/m.3523 type:complete len:757 (+) Transcript_1600:184-2454(+)
MKEDEGDVEIQATSTKDEGAKDSLNNGKAKPDQGRGVSENAASAIEREGEDPETNLAMQPGAEVSAPIQSENEETDDEAYLSADETFSEGPYVSGTPPQSPQRMPASEERSSHDTSGVSSPVSAKYNREDEGCLSSPSDEPTSPSTPASKEGNSGEEMYTVKDLDTGKRYVLEKAYRIKDLDSGQEFIVDGEQMNNNEKEIRSLIQIDTGEHLTMSQFERNIGLQSPLVREMYRRGGSEGDSDVDRVSDDEDEEEESVERGHDGNPMNRWIKKGFRNLRSKALGALADVDVELPGGSRWPKRQEQDTKETSSPSSQTTEQEYWQPGGGAGKPVKVNVQKKIYKEFTDLRMIQELGAHKGAVWSMKFSLDAQYLATAGQDEMVRVWTVISNPTKTTTTAESSDAEGTCCQPFFEERPHRLFVGHKADVLDLCWSKTQFLLSSSMDKTVRLWHISMNECLRVFHHTDFVTSIQFNPMDDKYFLSGSLDEKVRLWNIPEQTVTDWVNIHEMVTSTCFSPDGKKAVIGSYKGKCRFYSIEENQFEYITQIDVKNARGKNSRGKKITGIEYMPGVDRFLLITSNDSRIRMYDGFTLCCKYKGHKNANSQISSTFSSGGGFITCGSEDGCVYIWSTINSFIPSVNPFYTGYRRDKNASFEAFLAHDDIVTTALFAPQSTRRTSSPSLLPGMAPPTKAAEALVQPSLKRLGLNKSRADQQREEAQKAGEAAVAAAAAVGQIIITSGYSGEIRVFENLGLPLWL